MRSYLLYSSSAHILLLAVILFVSRNSFTRKQDQAYYIDFIGPSSVVTMAKAAAAEGGPEAPALKTAKAAMAAKAAEAPDEDDFSSGALPKPSILSSGARLFDDEKKAGGAAGEGGTPLTTDSANFPYPWYITQVREALWNAWTEKMPSGGSLRCTARFTINRNGSIKGVSVEKSSGNRLFDSAAESSVQAAAPFAPLPDDFYEDRLTVHVEFKAMD